MKTNYREKYKKEIKQIHAGIKEKKEGKLFRRDFIKGATSWKNFIERWKQRDGLTDEEVDNEIGWNIYRIYREEELSKRTKITQLKKAIVQPKAEEESKLSVCERAMIWLFRQMKIKGVKAYKITGQKLDYKTMWIVDFLSSKISTIFEHSVKGGSDLVLYKNPSDFSKKLKKYRAGLIPYKDTFINVTFKASEVREWLGFTSDQISIKDVVELFKKLQRVIFEIQSEPILFDHEGKHWAVVREESSILYTLRKDWYSIISNRWKTFDCVLKLRFSYENIMGWIFLHNLSCGKSGRITFSKEARTELSKQRQNILRETRLWKKPGGEKGYAVFELAKIAEYKYKEVYRLIKALTKDLEYLKKKKYIKDFKVEGRGKKTRFKPIK